MKSILINGYDYVDVVKERSSRVWFGFLQSYDTKIVVADSVREKIESLEQTVTTTRNAVAEVILMVLMILMVLVMMMMIAITL